MYVLYYEILILIFVHEAVRELFLSFLYSYFLNYKSHLGEIFCPKFETEFALLKSIKWTDQFFMLQLCGISISVM
jgi:hypothetical protein